MDVLRYLVEQGADKDCCDVRGTTPLLTAAHNGHLRMVRYLVEIGADMNMADEDGFSPLNKAAENGHLDVVRHLVEQGADMENAENDDTALISASYGGDVEVVRYLLDQGANRDKAGDADGHTPLHCAAQQGHLETAKLLMVYGADLNAMDQRGFLPIDLVEDNEELKQAILDEPRRRIDEAPGKRCIEEDRHPNAAPSASAPQQEEHEADEEVDGMNKRPRLEDGVEAEEREIADEDQDSEPSDEEDD